MKDLIDRQALKQTLGINADDCDKCAWGSNYGRCKRGGDFEDACCAIDDAPSTEPEIIHCRDCKYYDGRPCGIVDWYNTDSDFCSRAERRTDE